MFSRQIPGETLPLRKIADAQTMRALAHPVRIAILETLIIGGAMTATEMGEEIGESPTTCSFHLRQLARYGFVEEAGGGKGRARPWKVSAIGLEIAAGDDPDTRLASDALSHLFRERQLERYRTWLSTKHLYPQRWQDAALQSDNLYFGTIEEVEALNEEIGQLLMARMAGRLKDPSTRPPGAVPVELQIFSYPVVPPSEVER